MINSARIFENLCDISILDLAVGIHPFYPFLLSLLAKTGIDYELAGKAISIFFGSVTIFPIYYLAKEAYDKRIAVLCAFLFALHPYIYINSAELLRDSTSIFFLVFSVYFAWLGFGRDKYRYFVISGIAAALCYLTKTEGLFIILVIFSYIWLRDFKIGEYNFRERFYRSLSFLSIFIVVTLPFMVAYHIKIGSFDFKVTDSIKVLMGKTEAVKDRSQVLHGFSGTTGIHLLDMFLDYISVLKEAIFEPFLVLLSMNVLRFWTKKRLSPTENYLIIFLSIFLGLIFLFYLSSNVLPRRYFLGSIALMTIFMGYGFKILIDLCKKLNGIIKYRFIFKPGDILIFILFFALIFVNIFKGAKRQRYHNLALKIYGEYIYDNYGPDKLFLSDDKRLAYYAKGRQVELRNTDLNEVKIDGDCPYDFIALHNQRNYELIEQHPKIFDSKEYYLLELDLPSGINKMYVFGCSDLIGKSEIK